MLVANARKTARRVVDGAQYLGFRMASVCGRGPLRGHRRLRVDEVVWQDGQRFVAEIAGGEVFSDYGVILKDRKLISDLSPIMGSGRLEQHEALWLSDLGRSSYIAGRVAVISSHAHQRYYHWLFDILPRIEILRQSGLQFDRLIANSQMAYQRETLTALGIADVSNPQPHFRIVAEKLLVPSLPGPLGVPSPFAIRFLRDAFGLTAKPVRKLYVARGDALTRRVTNEARIINALPGFEVVLLDGMSVIEQARLFAEAAIVIGPHGAGLSNIVFMQPGGRVI